MMCESDPAKIVKLFSSLLRFFGKHGEHWTRGTYDDGNGKRCLAGAMAHVHSDNLSTIWAMDEYLWAAIAPNRKHSVTRFCISEHLIRFNDRCKDFGQLRAVIVKARALAQRDVARQPEIITANAVPAEKQQTAAARKRQLLAEVERERMVRHAAGDTRETYILCPITPERIPERLAA
jgi:hypothetical protein